MSSLGLVLFVVVALGFDFTNGFHDSANAVAIPIATRALKPLAALGLAAALNVVGALVSTSVAATVGRGIVVTPVGHDGLVLVFSALIGAIGWNLTTWWFGLPSSSTHALIGGLVGAALGASSTVEWHGVWEKVVVPMLLSPLFGILLGYLVMVAILWTFRRFRPATVREGFRRSQWLSSAAVSFSHGTQDAQKTMGVIALALVTTGHISHFYVPLWVILAASGSMGLGTAAGGWRVIRTIGSRITKLDPPRGFAAQAASATVLLASAYSYALPVSSTHVISSSVMGAGATRRLSAVRWGVAGRIVAAWVVTIPAAAAFAWIVYHIADFVVG